jgi:hypothetical protein
VSTTIAPPPSPLLKRGVYRAPYLTADGSAVFLAVDGNKRLAFTHELDPEDDAEKVTAAMWRELDRVDPEHSRRGKSYGDISPNN